ncbi:MAG: TrbG/VirB9 family P-type conjugative transfer protein [Acidiferrobacterales bacterium]
MNSVLRQALLAAGVLLVSTPAFAQPEHRIPERPPGAPHGRVAAVHRRHAERTAAQQWAQTGVAPALTGANGEIRYAYGESHPTVQCAPLHLCVITLLRHEQIVNLSLGDSVRWLAQPGQAGDRPIVVLKPTTVGLRTNLVITTNDGHLYYLNLVSGPARFVPEIGFYDPQALMQTVQSARALRAAQAQKRAQTVVASLPRIAAADLDFAYWWKGPKAERPVRVFSVQGKVYIQMPARLRYGNAPALFVVDHGAEQLVNYRMVGVYFVVDALFQEARLVLGVGKHRRIVTIHAGHRPLFSW